MDAKVRPAGPAPAIPTRSTVGDVMAETEKGSVLDIRCCFAFSLFVSLERKLEARASEGSYKSKKKSRAWSTSVR